MVRKLRPTWQAIAKEAQEYRDATIEKVRPPISDVDHEIPRNVFATIRSSLSAQEIEITELPAEKLLEYLQCGRFSAVSVTNAFLRRAAVAQKLVGLLLAIPLSCRDF